MLERFGKIKQFFIKRRFLSLVFLFCGLFLLAGASVVFADDKTAEEPTWLANFMVGVVGYPASWIVNLLGIVINILMTVLVAVAQYNDFINSPAVVNGWVVIRDVCNMFFIVILLVIAFSVILRVDGYDIKKMIPKLLIMAVLINFSRTICGLIIDVSQVIMLTFVQSFKNVAGGNLNEMLGIQKYLNMGKEGAVVPADGVQIIISYGAAIVFLIISAVVVIALLAVLVMRIVMLWIYVVLSPLAFFLASFPQGKSYSQKWWKDFTENVIVGPVLAFFLWLAFASLGSGSQEVLKGVDVSSAPKGFTGILTGPEILKYVISIAMLLGGLIISQGLAGATGGMAGNAMKKIQSGAGWAKKKTIDRAGRAIKESPAIKGAIAGGALAGPVGALVGGLAASKVGRTGDRLLGRAAGSLAPKGSNIAMALSSGGLVGASVAGIKNAPEKLLNKIREKTGGGSLEERQLKRDIARSTTSADGSFEHSGAKYRWNKDVKAYHQVDDNNNFKIDKETGKPQAGTILQYSEGKKAGQKVERMNALAASWVESGSNSSGVSNVAQDKKIGEAMSEIKNSGMGNEEAMRLLNNFSTSAPKKMALAMFLASNKAFKNKAEKDMARNAIKNNSVMAGKFDDEVIKNQAHLAYNLDSTNIDVKTREEARFKKDVSKGKVDVGNLSKDAIDDKFFQNALHKALTVTIERSDGKGGMEKINDDSRYAQAMKKNAENSNGANYTKVVEAVKNQIDKTKIASDRMAPLFAELSGDFKTAFEKDDKTLDYGAMGKFFRNTGTKGLSRVGSKDLEAFVKLDPKAGEAIAKEITSTKVKALDKDDDTRDLSEVLRKIMNEVVASGRGGESAEKIKRETAKINKDFYYSDGLDDDEDASGATVA